MHIKAFSRREILVFGPKIAYVLHNRYGSEQKTFFCLAKKCFLLRNGPFPENKVGEATLAKIIPPLYASDLFLPRAMLITGVHWIH